MGSGDTTVDKGDTGDWDPNAESRSTDQPDQGSGPGAVVSSATPGQNSPAPPATAESSPPPPTGQRLSDKADGTVKVRVVGSGTAVFGPNTTDPIIIDRRARASQWGILAALFVSAAVLAALLIALVVRSDLFNGSQEPAAEESTEPSSATAVSQQAGPAAPSIPTGQAGALESLRCPVMTDSIDRLFLAILDRSPTDAEFAQAVRQYRTGEQDLEAIAERLAEADGLLGLEDEAFVDRIYGNTRVRRVPENRDVWIAALQGGQSRGSFVIAISESQEFVEATRTSTPLSGFLRTYPAGTHWYCGVGARDDLPIKPLAETAVYADYMFHNAGEQDSQAGIQTVIDASPHLVVSSGAVPSGATSYRWNGLFEGDGNYGNALDIEAGPDTWWTIVFYPESIGEGRLGWQINS